MRYRLSLAPELACALLAWSSLHAQTAVDLKNQARNVDFSGALSTRPFKTGTVLPSVCAVGDSFFRTNAVAGQNLFGCTATNTWTLMSASLNNTGVAAGTYGSASLVPQITVDAQGRITSATNVAVSGGGGGGSTLPGVGGQAGRYLTNDGTNALWQTLTSSGLQDCVASVSGGVLTVGACSARNGSLDVNINACTASLTGTIASGVAYGYLSADGTYTLGHSAASTLQCSGWSVDTGVSAFPTDALPLFTASFAANSWNTGGVTPFRRMVSRDPYVAGDGLTSSNNTSTGITVLQVDSAQIPRYFTGSAVPTQNCMLGRDLFLNTSTGTLYQCTATNVWSALGSGGGGGGGGSSTIAPRRYPLWGLLTLNGGNATSAFSANETRWHQVHLQSGMTVTGIGMRATTGLGASRGLRFAVANTSGTILHKTAVNTTCSSGSLCEAAFSSSVTLAAGVYYIGVTTDSTILTSEQMSAFLNGTVVCAQSNAGTGPQVAGNGTVGSGASSTVDFGASMGSLSSYACNSGTNVLVGKFHDMYFY
jgi:hypothetical protein